MKAKIINRVVDASFIANMYRRTGKKPSEIVKELDSERTAFVFLEKHRGQIKTKGQQFFAEDMEKASALGYKIFLENTTKKNPVTFYTDEIKAVEAFLINKPEGRLVYPPTRSGVTAKSILQQARLAKEIKYRKERHLPVNIKGAKQLRTVIRENPEVKILFGSENQMHENEVFTYRIIPIYGKKSVKIPKSLLRVAIEYEREKARAKIKIESRETAAGV